jgi:hypothetical protein
MDYVEDPSKQDKRYDLSLAEWAQYPLHAFKLYRDHLWSQLEEFVTKKGIRFDLKQIGFFEHAPSSQTKKQPLTNEAC